MTHIRRSKTPQASAARAARMKLLHRLLDGRGFRYRGGERTGNLDDHRVTTVTTAPNKKPLRQ